MEIYPAEGVGMVAEKRERGHIHIHNIHSHIFLSQRFEENSTSIKQEHSTEGHTENTP